jgi:hypothetical protein
VNLAEEALLDLPARPVASVLAQLLEIRRESRNDPDVANPLLTIHLRSGQCITGWLIGAGGDKHGEGLVFWQPGADPRQPAHDALYVDPDSVEAVTVHKAGDIAHLLSPGGMGRPPGASAPTRLELRRKADEWFKVLAEEVAPLAWDISFESVPDSEDARWCLYDYLKQTFVALRVIGREELGRQALGSKVKSVRLLSRTAPLVSLEQGTLSVGASMEGERRSGPSQTEMHAAIARVL